MAIIKKTWESSEQMTEARDGLEEALADLQQCQEEILQAVETARGILRNAFGGDSPILRRAEAYWMGHIRGALEKEARGSMTTMEETIEEVQKEIDGLQEGIEAMEEKEQEEESTEEEEGEFRLIPGTCQRCQTKGVVWHDSGLCVECTSRGEGQDQASPDHCPQCKKPAPIILSSGVCSDCTEAAYDAYCPK